MHSTSKRINWFGLYFAFVISAGLLVATGLVPDFGVWYSSHLAQRQQTEALMNGQFALSYSRSDLEHDECWSGGGVQQVWGLGVSLWRLPFELLVRACGGNAFPDRLALGIAIFCVAFWVLKTFAQPTENGIKINKIGKAGLGTCLLVMLFPPFVGLLYSRMAVYEEVAAYAYLYGIALLLSLVQFVRQPSLGRWYLICFLSGFGPFLRPTLTFYGIATLLIAWLRLHWGTPVSGFPKFRVLPNTRWWLGPCIFALGGMLLFLSNQQRFGSGLEFGHRLNLQTGDSLFGSMYATRFDHPYEQEPIPSATKELFGALFLDKKFNGYDWYQNEIFPGQSTTIRWREFYLSTYDLSYFILIAAGCVWGLFHLKKPITEMNSENSEIRFLALWSLVSTALLAAFYLRTPVIASRYMLDFSPAFVAAILALHWKFTEAWNTSKKQALWLVAIGAWLSVQIVCTVHVNLTQSYGPPWTTTYADINKQLRELHQLHLLRGNQFETCGWNTNNGIVRTCTAVFVNNPKFIELKLVPKEKDMPLPKPEVIRAKIGTEFLKRESIESAGNGWLLRFHGPARADYQTGVQTAFFAFVTKDQLNSTNVPWRLMEIRWGNGTNDIRRCAAGL